MPVVSAFYGIVILMFYFDNKKHSLPHIHAQYGEFQAIVSIEDGEVIDGDIPKARMRMVQAWIEIHRDELMANWRLGGDRSAGLKDRPTEIRNAYGQSCVCRGNRELQIAH